MAIIIQLCLISFNHTKECVRYLHACTSPTLLHGKNICLSNQTCTCMKCSYSARNQFCITSYMLFEQNSYRAQPGQHSTCSLSHTILAVHCNYYVHVNACMYTYIHVQCMQLTYCTFSTNTMHDDGRTGHNFQWI